MAPKKAPRKAAKKAAAKHGPHNAGKDARRTFEHLGRVQAIASLTLREQESIALLVSMANGAFRNKRYKESADLLRAAEHLSFASIVESDANRMSVELISAIREEFEHLRERAEEHGGAGDAPKIIGAIYVRMIKDAKRAQQEGEYRKALELARGAEALTHIHHHDDKLIAVDEPQKKLRGSR